VIKRTPPRTQHTRVGKLCEPAEAKANYKQNTMTTAITSTSQAWTAAEGQCGLLTPTSFDTYF